MTKKQWLIKRNEDNLKQIIEELRSQYNQQEKYSLGKTKSIANVRDKWLVGIAGVIPILFGLSGANLLDSSSLSYFLAFTIALGIFLFAIFSWNKTNLELKLGDVLNAYNLMIVEFNANLKYLVKNTMNIEKSDLESIDAFYLYTLALEYAVAYYLVEPYTQLEDSKLLPTDLKNSMLDYVKEVEKTEDLMFKQYDIIDKDKLPMDCQLYFKKIIEKIKPHLKQKDYFKD